MKKWFLLLVLLFFGASCFNPAEAVQEPTGVTFIYINGSNNLSFKNRDKFRVDFIESVQKLHPQIKKRFEKDDLIREHFLRNGEYVINPEPITFYWGDRSLEVVKKLDQDLASASKYSPKIAHQARSLFAHCLHDAVWVQQHQNMTKVIDDLHVVVNNEVAKGNRVVLLGYSEKDEHEADFMSEIAETVYYIPMYEGEVSLSEKIVVIRDTPVSIEGENKVEKLVLKEQEILTDAVFILRECVAPSRLVPGLEVDENHVAVNRKMETNMKGLFACGDIVGAPYQYIKAAGEGNIAALSAVSFLAQKK